MTDYTKLVRALRRCCPQPEETCDGCPYDTAGECNISRMMFDAAAAIEALQAEVPKRGEWIVTTEMSDDGAVSQHINCSVCGFYWREPIVDFDEHGDGVITGELVRCKECIHFTQGGWCDREFDWFPVDENDFCSMAEKMEVQDGQKES